MAAGLHDSATLSVNRAHTANIATPSVPDALPIFSYRDADGLIVGTVTDTAMVPPGVSTSGITTSGDDVKLTVLTGGLSIQDDIALGAGDLRSEVRRAVTQSSGDTITAAGLQLLGTGTVNLDDNGNNVTTIAAK